ncbi:hypothetical protein AB0F30_16715 [Streptomyces sp. NPDC029006]|uniref:hypothetical protein n=1 Tax=Streptomyces sp. NPDC029006 TaxID=3155467 RepID=UPI0033DDB1C7
MRTVDTLIAQIRRNITDTDEAAAMMADVRGAHDRDGWDSAREALVRAETPLVQDGIRYESTSKAAWEMDSAAHAVWEGIRDLIEPAIDAEAEASADHVIEARTDGTHPDQYLSRMRYWLSACHPQDVYPIPLDQIAIWEHFRDAAKAYISRVFQDGIHYAVEAEFLKDQLTADQYRALTWPFEDLTDSSTSEER